MFDPWCIGGNWNAILCQADRNIAGGTKRNGKKFRHFLNSQNLLDIPMAGGRFTWTNSQSSPLLLRLDRFVMPMEWEDRCPGLVQTRLKRPISDHAPILLSCYGGTSFKSPFRFENYFLSHPDFLNSLRIWWNNLTFSGKPSFVLEKKLQGLKNFIKKWGRENFGSLQTEQDRLENLIDVMDSLEEINGLPQEEFAERENFRYRAHGITSLVINDTMGHDKDTINAENSIMLERPFTEDEVRNVVKCFGLKKSPGHDGYTMEFFKATWDIIKPELMNIFNEFHCTGRLYWRLHCTNIILLPKCEGVVSMHNYRPISLIGGIYKIISKCLADRMKIVMPIIISKYQGAFIDERQITDGNLITSELIDAREKSYTPGLVVKVDFQKAFDNINWNCLNYTMSRNIKGVRQGDPFSTFLFILVVEVLSLMIQRDANLNLIQGFKPSANGDTIHHLQYSDDLIMFLDNSEEHITNLKNLLIDFEIISGLKKFQQRLSNWQRRYLSKGGRLMLIKHVLCNLPIYYMSLFQIPSSVEKQLDNIMRCFLWGADKKMGWVGWNKVNLSKQRGGVGVKRLRLIDRDLHAKWIWRYNTERKAFRRSIINQKFGGSKDALLPNDSKTSVETSVGKSFWHGISSSHI
ncbi:uncharacterized protein LOC113272563 [Papaver somniferum]|uniref:uncharacterized protein LOC113272563 n=1 Tax=Papaver somniferum TaxID=3469 RepID=UPI000E70198B|nr:uncharacterized protein LOC113272563 [Papaver somniferum]